MAFSGQASVRPSPTRVSREEQGYGQDRGFGGTSSCRRVWPRFAVHRAADGAAGDPVPSWP